MNRVFLDTSAWVEYFEGSKEGEMIRGFLEDEATQLFTSMMTVAQLSDAYHRDRVTTKLGWQELQDFVQFNSTLVNLDIEGMAKAGALKADRRRNIKGFGLIDAVILQSSMHVDAKLITKDSHLLGESNAVPLS